MGPELQHTGPAHLVHYVIGADHLEAGHEHPQLLHIKILLQE